MIGKTISHYKILEKLGEGGMGVVYKAEDTKLERTVALKFLTPQAIGSEEDKVRFILEAKAAAKLDHANICTVYEIDEAGGQTFIAMAYVDGQSLEEKVESGVLEVHEALDIVIQAAEGLKEAHKKGIIHRDIKSANVMVTEDGQVRIMDFGLAKLAGRTRLTKTSTIMGTVAYMSPEQASGEAVDQRTDIWSLGVVLYKMLTGYPPFDAPSDAALIHKIIYEELIPISKLRSDIPTGLEDIIRKMLHKNPQERYEDMQSFLFDLRTVKSRMVSMAGKTSPSIAVLPFVNMSADPEQEYFCDGLAEELINALTQLEDLHVIARTSAFLFKGKNVNVRDIGRELDVQNVLEGSVRKAGNRLRITAQLVETSRGRHLWSERYDREMDDIFAIQDGITLAIVDKLKPRLLGEEKAKLARRHTVGLEAYDLYLRGRWYMNRMTKGDLESAIGYFEKAIEEKPDYAAAFASLAVSQGALSFFKGFVPKEVFPKAREAALKALELDDTLGEAHESLAMIKQLCDWDWEGAEKEFRRALDLSPGDAASRRSYALNLMYRGRLEEAMTEMRRALQLDPLSPFINRDAAILFWFAREPDMAIDVLTRTSELYPDYSITHFLLGIAYWIKSMYKEAMAEFQKEKDSATGLDPLVEAWIGFTWAMMGNREGLQQALEGLVEQSRQEYVPPFFPAGLSFFLGENDKGFEWMDKAYEERDVYLCYLKVHPFFDILDLRTDPRYIEILKKIGLDK